MSNHTDRAKSRSYYHRKLGDSQQMSTTVKESGQVHGVNEASLATRNRYNMSDQTGLSAREQFRGFGRMAQVLRWVSSSALAFDPYNNAKKFSEVQAGFVGKSLMLASNANQEAVANPIATVLRGALRTDPNPTVDPDPSNELNRSKEQRRRHHQQLHSFVHDKAFFDSFVQQAVQEAHQNRKQAVYRQLHGLRQSLINLASDETTGGFTAFDVSPPGNAKKDPSYHAEQRVLDYALEHHDELLAQVAQTKNIRSDKIHKMRLVVAGSKPPCHRCRTTEEQRGTTTDTEKTRLKTYRFETDSGAMFGALNKGATFSRHPTVEHLTHTALATDMAGTNTNKFSEPLLKQDSTAVHNGDLFSYTMARRDSVYEHFDSTSQDHTPVGRPKQ